MKNKNKLLLLAIFPLLFGLLVGILMLDPVIAQPAKTRVDEVKTSNFIMPNERSAFNVSENSPLVIEENKKELVFESKAQESDIKFNALGLQWEGEVPEGSSAEFYYKVKNQDWQKLEMIEEDEHFSNLMSEEGYDASFKVVLKKDHLAGATPKINNVKFYFLNTTQGPNGNNTGNLRNANTVSKNIISREDWGADESFRFWQPNYVEPKKFVIHHTAGGDGGDDPAATVRAIYYWHAVVLGWGDVGYNFLIDGQGNVYEGRFGGNGSVGAHTYNDIKNINYNEGTVGISIMGCYDSTGCNSPNKFTKKIRNSLTSLIAQKSKQLKIKPKGQSTLFDVTSRNIVGHKKLDSTLCPGDRISSKMKKIRNQTRDKFKNSKYYWRGKFKSSNLRTAYLGNWDLVVTIKYKNNGTRTWQRDKTWLKIYNDDSNNKISKFYHRSWEDNYGKFYFEEETVKPGQTATFTFRIMTPEKSGEYKNIFKMFINKNRVTKSKETITTRIDPMPGN